MEAIAYLYHVLQTFFFYFEGIVKKTIIIIIIPLKNCWIWDGNSHLTTSIHIQQVLKE